MNTLKTILSFFVSLFIKKIDTGVREDSRPVEEQQKDYTVDEVKTPTGVVYGTEPIKNPFFEADQYYTLSCIEHGSTFSLERALEKAGRKVPQLSKMYGYRQRSNYPAGGMWLQEAMEIQRKQGACLYQTMPTPMTEALANSMVIPDYAKQESPEFEGLEYYSFKDPTDFDALVSYAAQGYAPAICICATQDEWSEEYVQMLGYVSYETAPMRHCVAIVPNSQFIKNGIKYVVVTDSAHFGKRDQRNVPQDFIKARCVNAGVWLNVVLKGHQGVKPVHTFSIPLSLGMTGSEVVALQKCLIYEGLLPADLAIGNFYGRTLAAVKAFQNLYIDDILTPVGLTQPTGAVYAQTMKKLNALYGR